MSISDLKAKMPDYAKDLKLNIGSVIDEPVLSDDQRYGLFLSCALASGNDDVIKAAQGEAEGKVSAELVTAAKAAASIMAMNNVYYRFVHLASEPAYGTMPAKLRMNIIGRPGIDKADFELFSLAVSAINGCGMCIDSHEKVLRKEGVSQETIQAAVRIASVVHAIAKTLDGEAALVA